MFIGKVFPWLNNRLINRYVDAILSEHPDFVNLIIHNDLDVKIAKALNYNRIPFCISYHEVLTGLDVDQKLKPVVENTLSFGTPVIVHSPKTSLDLLKTSDDKNLENRIRLINLGVFESYLSYGEGSLPGGVPDKYLLYLGYIHPYKGLKYLLEAVKLIEDRLGDVRIVVAGGGYDPVISEMILNPRFVVYNHFISNVELVGLIRHCQAIVCPYIAASQSGLVQTAMIFNKPVIATKVGAFKEVVRDGVNGCLCEPADPKSLADTIIRFIERDEPFPISSVPNNLNWELIAGKYIQLFNEIQKIHENC